MRKQWKALLCMTMAVWLALAACACKGGKKASQTDSSVAQQSVVQPTTAAATPDETKPTESVAATADSPKPMGDQPVRYDIMEIKKDMDEIDAKFDSILTQQNYSGVVYVKFGNDYDAVMGKGIANKGAHKDNSIHTGFFAGSLTKIVTATAVMKLVEEKAIDLTSTIDMYFPQCAYGKDVTVGQLLDMTAGIPSYTENDTEGAQLLRLTPALEKTVKAENTAEQNHDAILRWIQSQPRKVTDGSWMLSDSNYFLLGDIIAQASGKSYEAYVKEAVLDPLEMDKTMFCESEVTARPYIGDEHSGMLLLDGVGYASLGMMTDMSDLIKLTEGLLQHQVIKEESFRAMTTGGKNGYGYGVYANGNRVSCVGELDAYSAKLSFSTDGEQMYIALTNDVHSDPANIYRLFGNYLEKYRN